MTKQEILIEALKDYEERNYMNRDFDWQEKINLLISEAEKGQPNPFHALVRNEIDDYVLSMKDNDIEFDEDDLQEKKIEIINGVVYKLAENDDFWEIITNAISSEIKLKEVEILENDGECR